MDILTKHYAANGVDVSDPIEIANIEMQAYKEGEKAIFKAQKAVDALIEKEKKEAEAAKKQATASAEEHKAAVAEAAKAAKEKQPGGVAKKKAADKAIGKKEVAKAAKTVGAVLPGIKPLTRTEIMKYVDLLCLPGGQGKAEKAVQNIGEALKSAFNSGLTDKQLYGAILKSVTGACK